MSVVLGRGRCRQRLRKRALPAATGSTRQDAKETKADTMNSRIRNRHTSLLIEIRPGADDDLRSDSPQVIVVHSAVRIQ